MVRTIDKNDDGNFEIVPDNFAHWVSIINPSDLYWENTGGQFVRRQIKSTFLYRGSVRIMAYHLR
mgnify:CR=1 FL=1